MSGVMVSDIIFFNVMLLVDVFLVGLLSLRQLVQGIQCILLCECDVFIDVIRDKYVNKCLAFNLVNAINYVDVWILSFGSAVICKEVCHICFNDGSTYFDGYDTVVSGWHPES